MSNYPSTEAMKAAVELEIMKCLGSVQTVAIGQLIQKVVDAESASLKARIQELEGALRLAAGAIGPLRHMAPAPESRVIRFTGAWAHLGSVTIKDILDRADAALEATPAGGTGK